MSSRCRLAGLNSVLVVGVQVVEHHTGQAAFEATQGFGGGGTGCDAFVVIGLAQSGQAGLGNRNAVQGGVDLAVARARHTHAAGGVT